jgi:hypothetical protein
MFINGQYRNVYGGVIEFFSSHSIILSRYLKPCYVIIMLFLYTAISNKLHSPDDGNHCLVYV